MVCLKKIMEHKLQVDGMVCSGCEMILESQIKNINGVTKVKAKYASGEVFITHDHNVNIQSIIEIIVDLDYKVVNIAQNDNIQSEKGINNEVKKESNMENKKLIAVIVIMLAVFLIIKTQ